MKKTKTLFKAVSGRKTVTYYIKNGHPFIVSIEIDGIRLACSNEELIDRGYDVACQDMARIRFRTENANQPMQAV